MRLIDADKLRKQLSKRNLDKSMLFLDGQTINALRALVDSQPTILEIPEKKEAENAVNRFATYVAKTFDLIERDGKEFEKNYREYLIKINRRK